MGQTAATAATMSRRSPTRRAAGRSPRSSWRGLPSKPAFPSARGGFSGWLDQVPGAPAGSWFEFYGPRSSPPCPQVGIIPWTWSEMLALLAEHILGIRPEAEGLRLRPLLLPGLDHAACVMPYGGGRLSVNVSRDATDAPAAKYESPGAWWPTTPPATSSCRPPRHSATTSRSISCSPATDVDGQEDAPPRLQLAHRPGLALGVGGRPGRHALDLPDRRRSLCEEFDGFVFNHNEALLYALGRGIRARAVRSGSGTLVRAGRGTSWAAGISSPTATCRRGESFVRQILIGKRYFKREVRRRAARRRQSRSLRPHARPRADPRRSPATTATCSAGPIAAWLPLPADDFIWVGYDGSTVLAHRASEHYNSSIGKARTKVERWLEADTAISRGHGPLGRRQPRRRPVAPDLGRWRN